MSTVATILSKNKGREIATVTEQDTTLAASQLMRERHIGSVIVLRGTAVVGIFTERDVLYRVVANSKDPAQTRVGEVMTAPVNSCESATSLSDCAQIMTGKRLRHMPVIDNGELCGVITSGDILAHKVSHLEETNIFLKEYMHGTQVE